VTYPLGWSVITQTVVRRERWPGGQRVKAIPLVQPGQEVLPDQPVLRFARELQQEALQSAARLSLPSAGTGTNVKEMPSGASNAAETIPAGLHGQVVSITPRGGVVIESRAAVVQGTLGAGNQVAGILTIWPGPGRMQHPIPAAAILVVPGPLNFTLLRQAASSGVAGIVASSISLRDLEGFLRTDLIQLIDTENAEQAQMRLPPFTLLLTEGLGGAAMPARILNLLSQYQGAIVLLSGATSTRQRIFPELIISLPINETQDWHPLQADPSPTLGALVRVCSGEQEGTTGTIDYLFAYEQTFKSGIRARAVRLRLEDNSLLVVPLTLIERIG